jgi:hypothetical protein
MISISSSLAHRMRLLAWAAGPALALALAGCGAGYVGVDGYDAAYVDAPVGVEAYPAYEFNDGVVYDVNGRWYHNHGGRWVSYRRPPPHGGRRR